MTGPTVCLPGLDETELVSVSITGRFGSPAYWPSWVRIAEVIDGIWSVSPSRPASLGPGGVTLLGFCGYQWTSAKSALPASAESTVWFHGWGLPGAVSPSGQLPGVVSTTPTWMVGSTAFIAAMYWAATAAYSAGPHSVGWVPAGGEPQWSSGSQFALYVPLP